MRELVSSSEEVAKLRLRLDRERRTRLEAEEIAERALREVYEHQQALAREVQSREGLEAQFRRAQKMEAVGRLAGGVAHDFNNLLTVILGNAELILSEFDLNGPERGLLEQIKNTAERAATLTRQLLAFSRRQVLAPVLLDLNAVVTEIAPMLERMIGSDIELALDLDASPRLVTADPAQMEQVVMNLVVNARDAMPDGGRVVIETCKADLDEAFRAVRAEVRPGPYSLLAIRDNGCGMEPHTIAHVFEPFFTTKESGKGTGLGLAVVYGIVKQSGGYVYVSSEPGRGTVFEIYLPHAQGAQAEARKPAVPGGGAAGGTETILLVEDEGVVRALAVQILRRYGYTVLEADGGAAALALCDRHGAGIDLLLTDVVMPGLNGPALAKQVLARRPTVKVLFVSGFTEILEVDQGVQAPAIALLQKPFTPVGLARKVREVLDAQPSPEG